MKRNTGTLIALFAALLSMNAQNLKIESIQPTPCLKKDKDRLSQLYYMNTENKGKTPVKAHLQVQALAAKFEFDFAMIDTGKSRVEFSLPEVKSSSAATFVFTSGKDRLTVEQELVPQKHWTIYLVQHSHSDIGYTHLQAHIARLHADYLDSALSYIKQTADYPEDSRFKWNEDITWSTEQYMNSRTAEQIKKLSEEIKNGTIEIAGWYTQMSDLCSHEEIIRNLYYSNVLRKKLGCTIQSAMCNDINGFPWSSPQLLSKCGIKYFSINLNEDRGKSPFGRPYPFYWRSPDGSKTLVWNGEHYMYANYALRYHEGYETSFPLVVNELLRLQGRSDYPYDIASYNISGYMTDNSKPNIKICDYTKTWNEKWEYPRIKISLMNDFFHELESRYSSAIPEHSGAWPDYWTDGTASTAYETALNRNSQPAMYAAEKTASVASMLNPSYIYPYEILNEANRLSLLYAEHTWGAWCSIWQPYAELTKGQWAIKSTYAYIASENSRNAMESATNAICKQISCKNPDAVVVFNNLGWNVSNVVKANIPDKFKDAGFEVLDSRTQKPAQVQITDGSGFMFYAKDIPSMGYAVYYFKKTSSKSTATKEKEITSFENNFFKLTFDPVTGAIMKITDKELNVQIVDTTSPVKLNQYIYEKPDPADSRVHNMTRTYKGFNRYSPEQATIRLIRNGDVAAVIMVESVPRQAKSLKQEIIVYHTLKKLEIISRYNKIETLEPEAVYFAFPFNVPKGRFTQEIANGTMIPGVEQLPNTSRDWMAVQQWTDVSNKNYGVLFSSLDAPMQQYGDINTGRWLDTLDIQNQTVYSYVMNNYWHTNFMASQGGEFIFRYVISTHKGDLNKIQATRFGYEQFHPLNAYLTTGTNTGKLPESYSFFSIDQNNVVIQAIKKAEDSDGFIVRLRETAGKEVKASVSSPLLVNSRNAYTTNILEDNQGSMAVSGGKFTVSIKPYEIVTIRIKP